MNDEELRRLRELFADREKERPPSRLGAFFHRLAGRFSHRLQRKRKGATHVEPTPRKKGAA